MEKRHNSDETSSATSPIVKYPQALVGQTPVLRGALRIEASTSTPNITAGTEFSIYVVIRNPFQVPVTIHTTETHIPIELSDEIWRKQQLLKRYSIQKERNLDLKSKIHQFYNRLLYMAFNFLSHFFPAKGPRVAVAVTTETQEQLESKPKQIVTIGTIDRADEVAIGDQFNLTFSGINDEDIQNILWGTSIYLIFAKSSLK